MARIISVTFDTVTHAQAGHLSVPRDVARFLGIGDDDPIEARIAWEGPKVEVSTRLASGLALYHRQNDPTTAELAILPPKTPIRVTVWTSSVGPEDDEITERRSEAQWSDEMFREAFLASVGSVEPLERLWKFAEEAELVQRYGYGESGPMYLSRMTNVGRIDVVAVSTRGAGEIIFKRNLDRVPAYAESDGRRALLSRIRDATGEEKPDALAESWFSVGRGVITNPLRLDQLLTVLEEVVSSLPPTAVQGTAGSVVSKYSVLASKLRDQEGAFEASFADIESMIGQALPPSARKHLAWWYGGGSSFARALRQAGWKASRVNLRTERLVLAPTAPLG